MKKWNLSLCVIALMLLILCGCNSVVVSSGIVTEKMYGRPLAVSVGPLAVSLVNVDSYCLLVTDLDGNTQWFVVSEAEYRILAVGSVFMFDSSRHRAL